MNHNNYSKDWCKGFYRTCGTACGEYCEQVFKLRNQNAQLAASCAAGAGKEARRGGRFQ